MVVSFSQVDLAFRFFFPLFYVYCTKCNIIPQCCKEKRQFNAWNTLSPELPELVGSQRTFFFFFFWPKLFFFSPSRVAFGVLMLRETKKIITVVLGVF